MSSGCMEVIVINIHRVLHNLLLVNSSMAFYCYYHFFTGRPINLRSGILDLAEPRRQTECDREDFAQEDIGQYCVDRSASVSA